ncbi:MAG: hypothetical protein EHM79_20825 [Geobacter sp.]|nr:MAG: hypothetical protein EHM79_20825 [Geobacter sp.]
MAGYRRDVFTVAGGAVAHTFGPVTSPVRFRELRLHISAAPTTAGSFTVTLDSVDGAAYDLVIYTIDPSTGSTVNLLVDDFSVLLLTGDALKVAYANADGRTIGAQLIFSEA